MSILTEGSHAGEALVAELPGQMSRDKVTIVTGQNLEANSVLGKITASGKYAIHNPAGADGTETAVAVLFEAVDATSADKSGIVFYKDAVFNAGELVYIAGISAPNKVLAVADLKLVGIIAR